MHSTFALAALAAVAYASPVPQAVTGHVAPTAPAPAGCSTSFSGKFQIAAVNVTSAGKRDLETRQTSCDSPNSLTITLADGTLTDALSRTGYIASNYQFQFDAPPQAGTIYNTGFSACSNSTLALGGSAIFYQCLSGSFYNLYDRHWAAQCNAVYLQILPCGGSVTGAPVTHIPDGQPQAPTGVAPPVTQIPDGQVQGPTGHVAPITQIGDGQIQVPTGSPKPVTQIGDGQIQAPTGTVAPITQIGDGQIQAPTGTVKPITQIGDGQIQAPTGNPKPITQIGDGQIQAPTGTVAPITQIGDGQIQAPKPTVAPITQIGDGQIQAPTGTVAPITQISDGQIQAPAVTATNTPPRPANTSTTIIPFKGGASGKYTALNSGFAAVVLAVAGAFLL